MVSRLSSVSYSPRGLTTSMDHSTQRKWKDYVIQMTVNDKKCSHDQVLIYPIFWAFLISLFFLIIFVLNPIDLEMDVDRTQYPVPAPTEGAGLLPTNSQPELRVTYDQFCSYYRDEVEPYHEHERIFRLLKQPNSPYLLKDDLQPCLQQLLMLHPGLEFLNAHPDFQHKYALTVITRVFYNVNRSGTGKIIWKEVRNSKFCQALKFVDENEDINKETRFFSYEHFYVLYCRFWELDTDRDGLLSREDLLKYGDHALSSAIVDRVFEVGPRPFRDGRGGGRSPDKMAYDDFIYFMLSEEDKGNEARWVAGFKQEF